DSKEHGLTYVLTYRDVVEILQLIDGSRNCESLDLQLGDLRLSATRTSGAVAAPAAPKTPAPPSVIAETLAQLEEPARHGEAAARVRTDSGLFVVRAPMLGTFYRAPAPGEAPYVQPGDVVGEDDTVGLIDVMKLFTQVPAGVAGRVVEIVAQDATLVEHGQPLVLIEPL
ncbi:MAG TPA: biotin/lipoyl-containing protein, partial [Burkholderiales bacterium]|nr:biotin/lipoyl-containing protein [Burkholderiales bacterium]